MPMVVIVVFVVWDRAGVIKDARLQLVGHVHPREALHASKVCDLLVAVVAGQAQSKHAGIIAFTQQQHSGVQLVMVHNDKGALAIMCAHQVVPQIQILDWQAGLTINIQVRSQLWVRESSNCLLCKLAKEPYPLADDLKLIAAGNKLSMLAIPQLHPEPECGLPRSGQGLVGPAKVFSDPEVEPWTLEEDPLRMPLVEMQIKHT
ncbi:MAG: hypothetical protein FRX49_06593 [Trebouxia sp. A1-2]|nr:MAG: hypothetical protein FRX49_06593 [Trebouxia sp. A1-2]